MWEKIQTEALYSHTLLITAPPPRCLLTPSPAAAVQMCQMCQMCPRGLSQQDTAVTKATLLSPCVLPCDGALGSSAENHHFPSKLFPHSLFLHSKRCTLLFPATSPHFNHLQQSKSIIYITYYLLHPTHS